MTATPGRPVGSSPPDATDLSYIRPYESAGHGIDVLPDRYLPAPVQTPEEARDDR
jgi:hypothetical protein